MDQTIVSGPFSRIEPIEFNLNSHTQLKEYLLSQGWKPTSFTDKGSPQLTEDSFASVEGDVPKLVARRSVLLHRIRLVKNTTKDGNEKGLCNLVRNDGRITAGGVPQGTPTGRFRHSGVVNIPKAYDPDVVYGTELRSLFVAKPGYTLVGCDASALEGRVQAHYVFPYTGGPELADLVLNGDIHQKNADAWGVTRKQAKSPYYGLMFGCQPTKLQEILGCSVSKARRIYNRFWVDYPPLAALKEDLTEAWNKRGGKNGGFIRGLDGRKLYGRSEHSLVNLLIQSAGAIICKTAVCYLNNWIQKEGLDAKQVIFMHDEVQLEVHPDHVDRVKVLAVKAFEKSGEFYKTNVPITGEAKDGPNWASTH